MSYGTKVESLIEGFVHTVSTTLRHNFSKAMQVTQRIDTFDDKQDLIEWLNETLQENDDIDMFGAIVEAAAVSDLLFTIRIAILADDEVDEEELELSMELLSKCLHRYAWITEYQRFEPLLEPTEVATLLRTWTRDDFILGGDVENGATLLPFSTLVTLTCMLTCDVSLHDTYTQFTIFVAKTIMSSGGFSPKEKKLESDLRQLHSNERSEIMAYIEATGMPVSQRSMDHETEESPNSDSESREKVLMESLTELQGLIGLPGVKSEVTKLTNFLKVREQRLAAGLPVPGQSLHFVFSGNPGTGKTTVARIVSRILFGYGLLKSPKVVEADRSTLVGGYVGQTAIKTAEAIDKAVGGVLFVDEAYTLSRSSFGNDYGQEAIDTILKKMEDLRGQITVIVAGYPQLMDEFISANPGLESRFTKFIRFDDYHASDLCQIFESLCESTSYKITQQARANLALICNRAYSKRDERFGNARFVRNAFEKTLGNHADRLANFDGPVTTENLSTIEARDLPFDMAIGMDGPIDAINSKWEVVCPSCEKAHCVGIAMIGKRVVCKCGAKYRCPWWNLKPESLPEFKGYKPSGRHVDLLGYDSTAE